jgi:hypothetical protein
VEANASAVTTAHSQPGGSPEAIDSISNMNHFKDLIDKALGLNMQ